MIRCESHGPVHGYIVCIHVLAGTPVAHRTPPGDGDGPDALGEALCEQCADLDVGSVKLDDVKLICGSYLVKVTGLERPH